MNKTLEASQIDHNFNKSHKKCEQNIGSEPNVRSLTFPNIRNSFEETKLLINVLIHDNRFNKVITQNNHSKKERKTQ